MSLDDIQLEMAELRGYSETAFKAEEAIQLIQALHILHRLRNKPIAGMAEDITRQRRAIFDVVIVILKKELVHSARDLNNRLTEWERTQPSG